jgi:hypothetical protein
VAGVERQRAPSIDKVLGARLHLDPSHPPNVESTFSAIKRKFGDSVKAKNGASMCNEVLAKFVCHNLCCPIQSMEEFGIDPSFGLRS